MQLHRLPDAHRLGLSCVGGAPAATYRLLTGQPKVYVKTADSGTRRRHSFCPNCGTPVAATGDTDTPATYSLRVGCLKQRADLPPKLRIWCRSALAWAQDVSGVPASPDGRLKAV